MAGWKRLSILAAICLALAGAHGAHGAAAQDGRDPIIDPPSGGVGSRFQIVGTQGWVPDETIALRLAFTTSPTPLEYSGPFPYEEQVTVLRDGTWSFPIVVTEDVLGFPLGVTPGFIVVQAQSATQTSTNAYVFTVNGVVPPGSEALMNAGSGPPRPTPSVALTMGLFALGCGVLLVAAGAGRRRADGGLPG